MPKTKTTSRYSSGPQLFYAIVGIVVLLAAVVTILELTNVTHFFHESQARKNALEAAKADNARKKALTDKNGASGSGKPPPASTTYTPPNNPNDIVVTAAQSGDSVTIISKLYNYSSGSCALHVSNNGKTYEASAQVIYQSQFSTCAGFSIPVNKLGVGSWSITLNVTSSGTTQTKTTSVRVQ